MRDERAFARACVGPLHPLTAAVLARSSLAPRPSSRSSNRGVTLLELLIVIALMGIIAALVVPMFGGPVSTSELRATARQLAAGLRLARSEAVSERRETFLVVDVAGPHTFVLGGDDLHRVASGWRPVRLEDGGWGWLGAGSAD